MSRQGQQFSLNLQKPLVLMVMGRQVAAFLLASSILTMNFGGAALAQVLDPSARPVRGQIVISHEVAITPNKDLVSLSLRDSDVRDVLQMLAKQGKFNLILDPGVTGTMTVDVNKISINKALEYVFTMMDLSYVKDGNTVMVAKKITMDTKHMAVKSLKSIPVQYKSAVNIANQLNNTIFKVPRSGGSTVALAAADPDSNSLLIMGSDTDIKLVGDALRELDVPRNRKVYHIRHNQPADVAQVLAANFFRNNIPISINSNGGASSSSSSSSTSGSSTNGSSSTGSSTNGSSTNGSSSSSGSSTNGSSSTGSTSGSSTGSSSGSSSTSVGVSVTSFTSDGVTFISEPVSSTLTVLGTEEQIALIDSVMEQVDVQRGQVAVEVALVEMSNLDNKSFAPTWGQMFAGTGLLNLSPLDAVNAGQNTLTFNNPFSKAGVTLPTSVRTSGVVIKESNRNTRTKVLANPTMVTLDGQPVSINITDTVASITTTVTVVNGASVTQPTVTQQQAGVTVSLTPKLYNDGSVMLLGLTPTVSQPAGVVNVGSNSVTLISTRSMSLAGVRVKDGETLVVGGLLQESLNLDISKVPGLDKMPILGAMFRAVNQNKKSKTELVLMVTPHILKEDNVTYFNNANTGKFSNLNYGRGGIVPISLPKFTGKEPEPVQGSLETTPIPAPAVPSSSNLPGADKTAAAPGEPISSLDKAVALHISSPSKTEKTAVVPASPVSTSIGQLSAVATPLPPMASINTLLQKPRIDIAPAQEKSDGVAALMLAKPSTEKSPMSNAQKGMPPVSPVLTNVYKNMSNQVFSTPGILDEILK